MIERRERDLPKSGKGERNYLRPHRKLEMLESEHWDLLEEKKKTIQKERKKKKAVVKLVRTLHRSVRSWS